VTYFGLLAPHRISGMAEAGHCGAYSVCSASMQPSPNYFGLLLKLPVL